MTRLADDPAVQAADGRSAIRLIATNPTLRAECARALPMLEGAKRPAEPEEVMAILVKHAPHYGVHAKGPSEWAALFSSYLTALEGLPAQAIEDGFLRWNRGEGHNDIRMAGFYPKAPQLCILAEKAKVSLYMAAYRARKALEYVEAQPKPQPTPEERERVKAQLRDLASQLGGRSVPSAAPPRHTPQQMAEELRAKADAVGHVI